jgi:broad specificity phosphatase PhoE
VERFSEVRRRAAAAARRLQALATDRGDVLVVGHGLMNTLIAAGAASTRLARRAIPVSFALAIRLVRGLIRPETE